MRIMDMPDYVTPSYTKPAQTHVDGCWMGETGHLGGCRTTETIVGEYGTAVKTTMHWSDGTKTTHVRTFLH